MRRRAALLLLAVLGGWLLTGVVVAGPASAHAELISTDPEAGARLDAVPEKVTLTFSEGVSVRAGYARVLDSHNARVDTGVPTVDGGVLTIRLRGDLGDGGYLVSYRVTSTDSHPVSGAFSFVVGNGELVATGAGGAGDSGTDPGVAAALPVARWIGFAGLALAVGIPVLVVTCWPAGWRSVRLRRLSEGGAVAVAVGALASFLLQGPYAAGSGLGSVLDLDLLNATVSTSYGVVLMVRMLLALYLIVALAPAWRRGARRSWVLGAGGTAALGLVVTTAAVGHPAAGPWPGLAVPVTSVHVGAMAVWLGGLTGLLAGVLRPDVPPGELGTALPRFSRLAFGSVVALVVTGVVQSVREVGSPDALVTTTYGRLLFAKLGLVLVILAAAGVSRVWVQQHLGVHRPRPGGGRRVTAHAFAAEAPAQTDDPGAEPADPAAEERAQAQAEAAAGQLPPFRRSVLVELVLAVAVLGVTSVLVGSPPAVSAIAQPVNVTLPLQGSSGASGSVQVSVDPARPGPNVLHLYLFDDAGRLTQPAEIHVSLTEPQQQLGPIDVALQPAGPGHYVAEDLSIPDAGTWTLRVSVRVDEFTARIASTEFPVR